MSKVIKLGRKLVAISSLFMALQFSPPAINNANAGILLLPVGIGIFFLIVGIRDGNLGLILLDEKGNLSDALENSIMQKYPQLNDMDAVRDLSSLVRDKYNSGNYVVESGKIKISLARDEIIKALAPTGLVETDLELVERLATDFE